MKKDRWLNSSRAPDAAVALPLFGVFLLMPPLIGLFATGLDIDGIPLITLYVFGIWGGLIVCAALLARHLDPTRSEETNNVEPQPDLRHR